HIVGPGRLLRRAIQADQLSSLIFYGPPGTGKTTLARIIANTTNAQFIALNAVLSGVKNIRQAIASAEDKMGMFGQRTILFIDEVHRFNKAQQDALLPHVENGTVILIGATTENPYFEVNKALVSRSRIFQLKSLTPEDLKQAARQALQDEERGYGKLKINLDDDALEHLISVANGDARGVLNALELAVETTPPDEKGLIHITVDIAAESIQRRAVLYDKDGDAHFDTISAFIKSLRGSDPDAALYWLAKMVYAGEDPRFIFRRMIILAGEDVGLADPNALNVVVSAARAFDYVGLPEGRFHLAEACLYLASCPKSNSTMAFFDALDAVQKEKAAEVPNHLRDANRDAEEMGHGAGYLYPHAYKDHWVAQQYLPEPLQGKVFYQPGDQGYEAAIRQQVLQRREAQLAAMLEPDPLSLDGLQPTAGPRAQNRWLQRTLSSVGQTLGQTRDRLFALARVQRHELILDLNAGTGLLTWEALRRAPVGGVYALTSNEQSAQALRQQAQSLDALSSPVILSGKISQLEALLSEIEADAADIRFDVILGRNALTKLPNKAKTLAYLKALLAPGGRLALAEVVPSQTQRLYKLLNLSALPKTLAEKLIQAEEAIYANPADPMVNWRAGDLQAALEKAGYAKAQVIKETQTAEFRLGRAHLARWFREGSGGVEEQGGRGVGERRPGYAQHLRKRLSAGEVEQVKALFERQLLNQTVSWQTQTAFVYGEKGESYAYA
ncbi:MAG TPA: AAA family ATPase, partial [Anaerolineae bacterium]|nr:AAA family ATPase [Anaerolineae bacterium]